jgi:uncharacterized protein (DUF2147 family)
MKRLFLAVVCFTIVGSVPILAADPAEGYWKSIDEKGVITAYWKIWVEGEELKGTIVKVPNKPDTDTCTACKGDVASLKGKPIIGTVWIWGFKKDGDKWAKGKIVDCGKGDLYWASIKPLKSGDALEMRGSIDRWGIAGRTQVWKRVTEEELAAIGVAK